MNIIQVLNLSSQKKYIKTAPKFLVGLGIFLYDCAKLLKLIGKKGKKNGF